MIKLNEKNLKLAHEVLSAVKNGFPKVVSRAFNRGVNSGNQMMQRKTASIYNVKVSDVKKSASVFKASPSNLTASLKPQGSPLPLIKMSKSDKSGVTATILKGKSVRVAGGFIQTGKSGRVNVFKRASDSRYPLKTLTTLSIPQMIDSHNIPQEVENKMAQVVDNEVIYEINRLLGIK